MELFLGFVAELTREGGRFGPQGTSPLAGKIDRDNVAQVAALLTIAERISRLTDNLPG